MNRNYQLDAEKYVSEYYVLSQNYNKNKQEIEDLLMMVANEDLAVIEELLKMSQIF